MSDRAQDARDTDRPMNLVERLCWAIRPAVPEDAEPMDALNDARDPVPSFEEQSEAAADEDVVNALREALDEFGDVSDTTKAYCLERLGREYVDVPDGHDHPKNSGIRYDDE